MSWHAKCSLPSCLWLKNVACLSSPLIRVLEWELVANFLRRFSILCFFSCGDEE